MIHRAIVGSPERFLMILIEHFAGAFPTWLSPVQVTVLPISDKHLDYAQAVVSQLKGQGVRVDLSDKNEPLNARIRDSELQKIPYILVVGDKEAKDSSVSVRKRGQKETGIQPLTSFLESILQEIASRKAN
jgi:threonyl-tRNA synthetase